MPGRVMVQGDPHSLLVMDIGRLMTLGRFPVLAGDSFEFNSSFLFRLNQLRRPLIADVKMEVFVFYCPYRYTYGDDWINYIEQGGKEAVTFPEVGTEDMHWLQAPFHPYPKHLWTDAAKIYNYHFRDPSFPELDEDTPPDLDQDLRVRGIKVSHLKGWGTAQSQIADLDDTAYDIDSSGATINVYNLMAQKSMAENEAYRQFFSSRYKEIMSDYAGAELHDYADDVPELVWREQAWMSGFDINGTSGAEMGASVGKAVGGINLRMPRRLFTEHGTLYVMGLLRMPPLFERSKQYLDDFNRPFNEVIPTPGSNFPPKELTLSDLFDGGSSASIGYVPHYEWYRQFPSYVHQRFYDNSSGWQYLNRPSSAAALTEVGSYDSMFQSTSLRHAVASCQHHIRAWRPLPDPITSIMGDA